MIRIRVLRLDLQDSPIETLSFLKITCIMRCYTLLQHLVDSQFHRSFLISLFGTIASIHFSCFLDARLIYLQYICLKDAICLLCVTSAHLAPHRPEC